MPYLTIPILSHKYVDVNRSYVDKCCIIVVMDKLQILNALNPDWWTVSMPNNWQTSFVSANIVFTNNSGLEMTYTSSAPYITYGLNASGSNTTYDANTGVMTPSSAPVNERTDNGVNTLSSLVNELMTQTSQRLYDMHCTSIVGSNPLTSEFDSQS